jgi:hypothetical protein
LFLDVGDAQRAAGAFRRYAETVPNTHASARAWNQVKPHIERCEEIRPLLPLQVIGQTAHLANGSVDLFGGTCFCIDIGHASIKRRIDC